MISRDAFEGCSPDCAFFYEGTTSQWEAIAFTDAFDDGVYPEKAVDETRLYFYSETKPSDSGNYWHYVDGNPQKW